MIHTVFYYCKEEYSEWERKPCILVHSVHLLGMQMIQRSLSTHRPAKIST